MTPTDEATFIALWQRRRTRVEIAQALGVAPGTVGTRAPRLVGQGKPKARPCGGLRWRWRCVRQKGQAIMRVLVKAWHGRDWDWPKHRVIDAVAPVAAEAFELVGVEAADDQR